jgi:hypothetical protein
MAEREKGSEPVAQPSTVETVPAIAAPSPAGRRRRRTRFGLIAGLILVALLLMTLVLAGRLGPLVSGSAVDSPPAAAAQAWMQAYGAGDAQKLTDLTCAASRDSVRAAVAQPAAGGIFSAFVGSGHPPINVDQLRYRTTRNDGTTADVQVSGRIEVEVRPAPQVFELDSAVRMRNEDGAWRYCDSGS